MDCFVLLWIFDSRWLCRFRPSLHQQLLLLPISLNIAFIVLAIDARLQCANPTTAPLFATILVGLLVLVELVMYIKLFLARQKAKKQASETTKQTQYSSIERIINFKRQTQAKRAICGCYGLLVLVLSLVSITVDFITISEKECQALGLSIQLRVNAVFWLLICLIAGVFVVIKGLFLLMAWRHSDVYLRFRNVT